MMSPTVGSRLAAVRRRLRLQAALEGSARAAVIAGAAAAVAIYLERLDVLSIGALTRLLIALLAGVGLAGLARALGRVPLERVAKRIDQSHALHDRLGSALVFAAEPSPTPFMQAALADAEAVAGSVDPRRAAPLVAPRALKPAAAFVTCAALVALVHFPSRAGVGVPSVPSVPKLAVDPEVLQPEREAIEALQAAALDAQDEDTQRLAKQMQSLLDQLDRQELTRKQVFDQLAQMEKQLKADDGSFEDLKRQLRKAGEQLAKDKLTKEAGDALAKDDLEKARKELEKLADDAEKLAQDKKNDPKREELARALERAAKPEAKTPEEQKRDAEEQRLREEQRRLKREQEQNPNDPEVARRLKRNQRELERLERDKQQRAEQKRQLERLQRELQKAAEQLRQKLSPEAAEALRKAAQEMRQMEQEIKKLGNQGRAQVQIAELKEVLRRAGQSGRGQNGEGQGQAQNGHGQSGDGKGGKNQKNGKGQSMLRDFNDRAGGGQKTLIIDPSNPGGNGPQVLLPIPGGPGEQKPGPSGDKGNDQPGQTGDGIGDSHDPHVMGDPTKLAARTHATRVEGKEGAGESKSETILGSADKGFASRAYKRAYTDYSSVVEEVMSKERVPPGYRYYVKRYFQLIKPRD